LRCLLCLARWKSPPAGDVPLRRPVKHGAWVASPPSSFAAASEDAGEWFGVGRDVPSPLTLLAPSASSARARLGVWGGVPLSPVLLAALRLCVSTPWRGAGYQFVAFLRASAPQRENALGLGVVPPPPVFLAALRLSVSRLSVYSASRTSTRSRLTA
jgi:hypothetical protein